MKKQNLLLLPLLLLSIISCETKNAENEYEASIANVPNATYDNLGWLKFSDGNAFRSTLSILEVADSVYEDSHSITFNLITPGLAPHQVDSIYQYHNYSEGAPLDQFENNFQNFISLRSKLSVDEQNWLSASGSTLDYSIEPSHSLDIDYLNCLVNSNGEVQVGNNVYFFNKEGNCIVSPRSSINTINIATIRQVAKDGYLPSSVTTTTTITDTALLSEILHGVNGMYNSNSDPEYVVQVVIVINGVAIMLYIIEDIGTWFDDLDGGEEDCKFKHVVNDKITISSTEEYRLKSKFGGWIVVGQYSFGRISHFEYINGKWEKTPSQMGFYIETPYKNRGTDCSDPIDGTHYINDVSTPHIKTKKRVAKSKRMSRYHNKKITKGDRFADFYVGTVNTKTLIHTW